MSRIRVFDLGGRDVAQFEGRLSRGWAIAGSADVRGGGQSTVEISQATAADAALQLGRIVLVDDSRLPVWCGIIDPNWGAYSKPVLTVYNVEYLLSLRMPDGIESFTGSTGAFVSRLLQIANAQEDLLLRLGRVEADPSYAATIDRRTIWEQMKEFVAYAGMELTFRPEIQGGVLTVYVDVLKKTGALTNFLYHDGDGANMQVASGDVNEQIWNRVLAINDAASEAERMIAGPFVDASSIQSFRLRSIVVQFDAVTGMSDLEARGRAFLDANSRPRLALTVNILDRGDAFHNARLGNIVLFHAANLRLPGGVHGYRGPARIMAMAYDEASNTLGLTAVASL